MSDFPSFPKTTHYSGLYGVVTEKIDGTNGLVFVSDNREVRAGSRNRWLTPENDNYGFAAWVEANKDLLARLGPGHHYGEWWGTGIGRGYGVDYRAFSLFDAPRWREAFKDEVRFPLAMRLVARLDYVPILHFGPMYAEVPFRCDENLYLNGSVAAEGYMYPEGVVVQYLTGGSYMERPRFKISDNHAGKTPGGQPRRDPDYWKKHKNKYASELF